jgi:O-acetyl-ADP-ribose deacetylase (regulator of RNase III)
MRAITYLNGDATYPCGNDVKIIAHVCNDRRIWGSGFVLSVSKRWPEARKAYIDGFLRLGEVIYVDVGEFPEDIVVANMIAQRGTISCANPVPADLLALELCLSDVAAYAKVILASVHIPRLCCGRGGETWDNVEPIIQKTLCEKDISVFVYDLV